MIKFIIVIAFIATAFIKWYIPIIILAILFCYALFRMGRVEDDSMTDEHYGQTEKDINDIPWGDVRP